jgi:hypothetical protein
MADREKVKALLLGHRERRPLMRATDFYKLLYQGVFGVGHIMGDGAWGWLTKEADGLDLDDQPDEPLVEAVSADGAMVRVNLRPYIRGGGSIEELFEAMKATAPVEGSPEMFMDAWRVFLGLVDEGLIEVDPGELSLLVEELRLEGVSPHHHSGEYRGAYSPAYRVVRREALELA